MKYEQELLKEIELRDQIIESLQGRSTASKSIIVTSDMHVGHKWSLGGELTNVNDFWYEARDKLLKPRSNLFIINGEPIDGDNKREGGHGLWSTNLVAQMRVALDYLKHYKMDKIGMTRGSNYHTTKDNTSIEEVFALIQQIAPVLEYEMFGGIQTTKKTGYFDGHHISTVIDDLIQLRVNGKIFNILHHVGYSSFMSYVPTKIAAEMAKMVFLEGKLWSKEDTPSVVVRGHTHHYVQVKFPRTIGVVCPAWKVTDRFGLKSGMNAATVGLVEFVVEQNGYITVNDITLSDESYPKVSVVDV